MNGWTRFFLVILRLAIGWLFLFEGIEKVESVWRGPTSTGKPFTSEPYLRASSGPMAAVIRSQIGDLDQAALERLKPFEGGSSSPKDRLSPALKADWDEYARRFTEHYQLDEEQKKLAAAKLEQAKEEAGRWLGSGEKEIDKPLAGASVKVMAGTKERVAAYGSKLDLIRDTQGNKLPAFEKDVEKAKLRTLKDEAAKLRTELLADLNQPLRDALQSVLTPEQKKFDVLPEKPKHAWYERTKLEWADAITIWLVLAVGACLLAGLFTRTACVLGALFLGMLYVTLPPLPGLPETLGVEGHPFIVNKNLIMAIALLALATTRSGHWVGLDGLMRSMNPFRRKNEM
jgi:uncharacterized membrane protein YphA (DoxX/SURF4 family)